MRRRVHPFGNKIFVVEADNSSDEFKFVSEPGIYQSQILNTPAVLDGARGQTGNFWDFLDNNFFVYNKLRGDTPLVASFGQETDTSPLGEETGRIFIEGSKSNVLTPKALSKIFMKIDRALIVRHTDTPGDDGLVHLTDHYMDLNTPVKESGIEGMSLPLQPKLYSSRSEYNFFIRDYEESTRSIAINDNLLPNMYCLEFYSFQPDGAANSDSKINVSVGNSVPRKYYEITALSPSVSGEYFDFLPKVYRDVIKIINEENFNPAATQSKEEMKEAVQKTLSAGNEEIDEAVGGSSSALESQGGTTEPPTVANTPPSSPGPLSLGAKFSNIIFSHKDVETINKIQEKKELFPMFNEVKFSTEPVGEILSILEESDSLDSLVYSYVASEMGDEILPSQPLNFRSVLHLRRPIMGDVSFSETSVVNTYDPFQNLKNDFLLFTKQNSFEFGFGDASSTIAYINSSGITPQEKFDFANFTNIEKFKRNLLNVVAKTKLRDLFSKKQRTLEEIYDGKPSYNETLFYKISKYSNTIDDLGTRTRGPLIQKIYIPNSSNVNILHYIDTQVKYNKSYVYTVSAVKVVVGSQYEYTDLEEVWAYPNPLITDTDEDSDDPALLGVAVDYKIKPSIRMFEVPIIPNIEARVVDSPPIFPNVDIVPFVNGSNNIRINLSNNTGEYYLKPIIIDPSEEIEFDKVRQSQKIPAPEPILFKNDDLPASFEIRRLNTPPRSYSDFVNAVVSSISTTYQSEANPKNKIITDSVSFIDVLQVNTNYYYTFRMTDTHGHISYPSPVYRVKLIESTPGFIYPEIAAYEFQDLKMFNTTFPFRKYLCIKPSLSQVVLDNQDDIPSKVDEFNVSTAKVGSREEGLVGKKFKMRIVSKSSNKKMDFNFQFGRVNTENQ